MKKAQEAVKKFNEERNWMNHERLKDLLLNMNEEIGEFWNVFKWLDTDKQNEMIHKNKEEVGNFIGDMQYLILKIAALYDIDSEEETYKVLREYERRFPIDKIKEHGHSNVKAGGFDNK